MFLAWVSYGGLFKEDIRNTSTCNVVNSPTGHAVVCTPEFLGKSSVILVQLDLIAGYFRLRSLLA